MKSTLTDLDDNKVKLTVEVEEAEFESALDVTFKKIAQEVRIPGFRPGKVPRKILEARLDPGFARAEALREALPDYYGEACREHAVDAIASPEIDITDGAEDGNVVFDAVVEVRPQVSVEGYDALTVEIPSPVATDNEVDEQIDNIRGQYADLVEADRAAIDGDHVLIDISGSQDGEELGGLTASDYSYEVGSLAVVEELDENLRGAKTGDILEFSADHPSDDDVRIDFRILVKGVREKVLPDLTDEWASENTEFDTVQDMRADTIARISEFKRERASGTLNDKVAGALAELVTDDPPEALVLVMMDENVQNFAMQLQAQGIPIEQWLQMTGTTPEQFREQMREGATTTAKVDLGLRAVAAAESLEPTDTDIEEQLDAAGAQMGMDADSVRDALEQADGLLGLKSEILKRKALTWLVDHASLVDDEGNPIDRTLLDSVDSEPTDTDEPSADQGADMEDEQ